MTRHLLILLSALLIAASNVAAAEEEPVFDWVTKETQAPPLPPEGEAAPVGGLPDGRIAVAEDEGQSIIEAWYGQPTTRYAHAILGDGIEGGSLNVVTREGETLELVLPEELVFEDRTPRIVDFDGFGDSHVVTILSSATEGAAIAIFGLVDGELQEVARTPFIGLANRWRNIAGIDDFDGDGSAQIAEVVTPHIGGTLNFWTWRQGELVPSGSMAGFSNHEIGAREQRLSVAADFDGDGVTDLAVPTADRRAIRIVVFRGEANGPKLLKVLHEQPLPAQAAGPLVRHWHGVGLTVGLKDGRWIDIAR